MRLAIRMQYFQRVLLSRLVTGIIKFNYKKITFFGKFIQSNFYSYFFICFFVSNQIAFASQTNTVITNNDFIAQINGELVPISYFDQLYKKFETESKQLYGKAIENIKDKTLDMMLEKVILKQMYKLYEVENTEEESNYIQISIKTTVNNQVSKSNENNNNELIDQTTILAMETSLNVKLMSKVTEHIQISDQEAKEHYDQHIDRFTEPAQYSGRFIYISAWFDDEEEILKAKEKAISILNRIKLGATSFSEIASEYADDGPIQVSGGELGPFYKGSKDPELEEAFFSLKDGELIQTPYRGEMGWYIVYRGFTKDFFISPFETVKSSIKSGLKFEKSLAYFEGWLKKKEKSSGNYLQCTVTTEI